MCSVQDRIPAQVVGLSLSSNNLNGVLPPSLGNLSSIVGLSLGRQGGHFFPDYVQSDSLMSLRLTTGCMEPDLVWVEGLFSIRKRSGRFGASCTLRAQGVWRQQSRRSAKSALKFDSRDSISTGAASGFPIQISMPRVCTANPPVQLKSKDRRTLSGERACGGIYACARSHMPVGRSCSWMGMS